MRDRDAGDGGPPDVIIRDQEGAGYRGQHPDLVTGVREVRPDGRLDLADDLERARAHDGNARTRTGLRVPAPPPPITRRHLPAPAGSWLRSSLRSAPGSEQDTLAEQRQAGASEHLALDHLDVLTR